MISFNLLFTFLEKDESATVYTNSHRTYTTASSQSYSSQSYCDSIDSSNQSYVISDAFTIPANEYDENHTMKRPKLIQSYLNSSFSVSNHSEPCNFSMGSVSIRPAPMPSKQNLRVPGTQKIPRFSLPPQRPIYPSPLTSSSFNRYCDIPQKSVNPQNNKRVIPTPSEDEFRLSQFRPPSRPKATVNLPPPPMPVRLSPQIIPEPIHTEVRLDYIRLYVNAMNSLDRQIFAQYVDRYIHPNCVIQISNIKQSYPRQNHRFIINVVGKQFLISMYDLILKKYPDFCYRIMNDKTESQILRENSMLLSSHVKLEGVDPMASFKQITCPSVSDSPVSLMFTNYTFNTFVDYSFENTKFTFDGTKSVYIDASGLITAMTLS